MEKTLPLAINIVLSSLSSFGKWPIDQIAGFENWPCIVIAIAACIGGTALGIRRRKTSVLIIVAISLVAAVFWYTYLISRGGIPVPELLLGLLLYFYIFFAVSYGLTYLELIVIQRTKTS
jgi:hypothetical protein